MPKRKDIKKVMVIGSGPIIIGQAAEFDYAGTQACKALKEEGLEVILLNSNPATIMTDTNIADHVYIEPLTAEFVEKVIAMERPDGLLPTLGGQTGLNLAVEVSEAGVLDRYGVCLLGTPLEAIKKAEDRELFKKTMESIGEPVPDSAIISSLNAARDFASAAGYPLIVRPAYTLGGTGGGIAEDEEQLLDIVSRGLKNSRIGQVLLEKSVVGWKEIEYEVMRDAGDNAITICNMENIDPMGIHTGDSIVVAPSQTLSDKEYQMLRGAALKIIRALGIEGGCNVQFALDPRSFQYYVIEVNPRVSRSSALASKATGYPIAKVAAKVAIGLHLDEILNSVTGKTFACFEPVLDYVVTKIPRWPFDKFVTANRTLGTQMKATGEVMAIDRTFEASLMKAVRSLEIGLYGLRIPALADWTDLQLASKLKNADDERLFAAAEALRRGMAVERIVELSGIDRFFIEKLDRIVEMEELLSGCQLPKGSGDGSTSGDAPVDRSPDHTDSTLAHHIKAAKRLGFSDRYIAQLTGSTEADVRAYRKSRGIEPVYKLVDTCSAEFEAITPYYYSAYEHEDEVPVSDRKKVLVLGSGPIRIGQGIEFDYCSVHSVWGLKEAGVEAVIINNNPETVSTDFDTSDKLYFEPLTAEDVMNVVDKEKPEGVVVQFGGQTAINLAEPLAKMGVKVLGTETANIDVAEDREKFSRLLQALDIPQADGKTATSINEAMGIALKIGFPVLVRPSYVLGGRAMEIVYDESELFEYMRFATAVSPDRPVLIDKYLTGKEVEVDAVADGEEILIPGIMEHIERAGVHSGDSFAVFPPQTLADEEIRTVVEYTERLSKALSVKGLINVQYVIHQGKVYCLEVNPRASRTVPILSKVTGVPMVKLATQIMLGRRLRDLGYGVGLLPPPDYVAVKAPVFSFEKLGLVETSLGPEMKSTGEVLGIGPDFATALTKVILALGMNVKPGGTALLSIAEKDRKEVLPVVELLRSLGYTIVATTDTARFLTEKGVEVETVFRVGEGLPNALDVIREGKVGLVINTPTKGKVPGKSGFKIRRAAVEYKVPCLTSLDTALAVLKVLHLNLQNRSAGGIVPYKLESETRKVFCGGGRVAV